MLEFVVFILCMYLAVKISKKTAGSGHSFRHKNNFDENVFIKVTVFFLIYRVLHPLSPTTFVYYTIIKHPP